MTSSWAWPLETCIPSCFIYKENETGKPWVPHTIRDKLVVPGNVTLSPCLITYLGDKRVLNVRQYARKLNASCVVELLLFSFLLLIFVIFHCVCGTGDWTLFFTCLLNLIQLCIVALISLVCFICWHFCSTPRLGSQAMFYSSLRPDNDDRICHTLNPWELAVLWVRRTPQHLIWHVVRVGSEPKWFCQD